MCVYIGLTGGVLPMKHKYGSLLARGYTGTPDVTCGAQRKFLSGDELDMTNNGLN